jgi:ribonuclease Z
MQMRRFGHNPARVHHIFISHLHGDHIFGLFGLLSTLAMMGRKVPMQLYGPAVLKDMMDQHLGFFGPFPFHLEFHPADPSGKGFIFEDDKMSVRAIPLKHRTETYGYLFREKPRALNVRKERIAEYGLGIADLVRVKRGEDYVTAAGKVVPNHLLTHPPYRQRSYAYISDTLFDLTLAETLRDVDLLFHEATFAARDEKLAMETLHATSVQAATLAREAGVGKLLIGHFSSRYRDHSSLVEEARQVFRDTEGVDDGDLYSIPMRREIRE